MSAKLAAVKPIDIYVRVSKTGGRDVQAQDGAADVQERKCREKLAAFNLPVGVVHRDIDQSGGKVSRPGWNALVERLNSGQAGGFIVAYGSREARNMISGEQIIDLGQRGHTILFGDSPAIDWNNPYEVGMYRMRMVFQTMEREAKGQQLKESRDRALSQGIPVRALAVGYAKGREVGLEVAPHQAAKQWSKLPTVEAVVREAFLSRARGRSWNQIASDFEAAGIPTATGEAKWHMNGVRSLISDPIYKGLILNGRPHYFPEYAMVNATEWQAAQPSKRDAGQALAPRGNYALLSGLVVCQGCGRALTPGQTTRGDKKYAYYRCSTRGCTAKARASVDALDAYVADIALWILGEHAEHGAVTQGKDVDVEAQVALESAVTEAKARRRAAALALDPDDPDDMTALETLGTDVERAELALADALAQQKVQVSPAYWSENWDAWNLEDRRAAVRSVVAHVRVERGAKVEGLLTTGVEVEAGDRGDGRSRIVNGTWGPGAEAEIHLP